MQMSRAKYLGEERQGEAEAPGECSRLCSSRTNFSWPLPPGACATAEQQSSSSQSSPPADHSCVQLLPIPSCPPGCSPRAGAPKARAEPPCYSCTASGLICKSKHQNQPQFLLVAAGAAWLEGSEGKLGVTWAHGQPVPGPVGRKLPGDAMPISPAFAV